MAYVKDGEAARGSTHPNLGSDKSADGIVSHGTLGESNGVLFGELLYLNKYDKKYYKGRANTDEMMPIRVMAARTVNNGCVIPLLKQGYVRNDAWTFMPGTKLYVSTETAGAITQAAPSDYRQEIGEVDDRGNIIYFNPEPNYHYGSSERTTIKDLQTDVNGLFERQQIPYICKIWEAGQKTIIKAGKHVRLKVIDASVRVGDNSFDSQTIEIIGITNPIEISETYKAGVEIPLDIIRDTIGLNEQIEVIAYGNRKMSVELMCESDE